MPHAWIQSFLRHSGGIFLIFLIFEIVAFWNVFVIVVVSLSLLALVRVCVSVCDSVVGLMVVVGVIASLPCPLCGEEDDDAE